MHNATRIHPETHDPEIRDPSISDFPMTDDPSAPRQEKIIARDDDEADANTDKSMPQQRGSNLGTEEDYSEVGGSKFQKNEDHKHGRKPKGDESIANRGVTHVDPNKDKAV